MFRLATMLVMLTSVSSRAHDLWLIPPEAASSGQAIVIRAVSGDRFPHGDGAPDPHRFVRRLAIGADGKERALQPRGTQENPPAGLLEFIPATKGIWIAAVETAPKLITLDAQKFNEYLVGDGLGHIWRWRAQEKTLDRAARERYSKSPKVLIPVDDDVGDASAVIGLPLEIVPLRNPFQAKVGAVLPVRVLFRGKPLADARLGYCLPDDGDEPRAVLRTDTNGEALVPLSRAGMTTIRLTHMTRPQTPDFEWESFWTTLTFRVP